MTDTLVRAGEAPDLGETAARARDYLRAAKAPNTRRAYRSDWADFAAWCAVHGQTALPAQPETVALYVTERAATHRPATLTRRLTAISQAHQAQGRESPTRALAVRAVMAGIRRLHGTHQEGKAPAVTADLLAMLATLPRRPLGVRDRALLLVGFAGAFRRSELVALDRADVEFRAGGVILHVRRSKTDPEGQGTQKAIPYGQGKDTCPVRALKAWGLLLDAAGGAEGALFRSLTRHGTIQGRLSDRAVALAVKRCAAAAGLDPDRYAGHSLRSGLATSAAEAGVSERSIMQQTGHQTTRMVRRYIRSAQQFQDNAAGKVGL